MSYRLRPGAKLTREIRRIATEQYRQAIAVLRTQPDGEAEAIHDARKCFKRLRGLMRLISGAAPDFAARENARLRDAARTLSQLRDATALVEALDHLIESEATADNHEVLFGIRSRLAERRDRIAAADTAGAERITAAISACEAGIAALDGLSLPGKRARAAKLVSRGVAKNYGRAVSALETALASGDPAHWHDLRKRIKYHRMHVQLLGALWPGEMALRADVADLAGEALGDDHDLVTLDALIAADPDTLGTTDEIAVLRGCMAARATRLHAQVRDLVTNLLADDRKLVERRIEALYKDAAD
ncbi:CHAD domain-containing protein [Hoeflea olei]|uniref:CHAD domain-containing protein n=1 Tax=Hoeflea olei TaxID=1480615 RepID=A0A1C1YWT1_9HYPH|nr:CHAD domain-containing protein [Hoeflea olei]OCW57942.1 hypothetical protein AWJ14_03900 [Hoeflea olei]